MLTIRGLERSIHDNSNSDLGVAVPDAINTLAVDEHFPSTRPSSQ